MLNPFGPEKEPGLIYYAGLQKRMLQRVQLAKINDQVFQAVQQAYEDALKAEGIVISRPERIRMLYQILKLVLADMLKKLDKVSI
jgi:hypothetical protein